MHAAPGNGILEFGTVTTSPLACPNGPVQRKLSGSPAGSEEPDPFRVTCAPAAEVQATVSPGPGLAMGGLAVPAVSAAPAGHGPRRPRPLYSRAAGGRMVV